MVKDMLKQDLEIGCTVVFNPSNHRGIYIGKIVNFTPKMAEIDINGFAVLKEEDLEKLLKLMIKLKLQKKNTQRNTYNDI